jgi:hypothetical protein
MAQPTLLRTSILVLVLLAAALSASLIWAGEPSRAAAVRSDQPIDPVAEHAWGKLGSMADPSRAQYFRSGGPNDTPYRRCTVLDGDDSDGERCEYGYNSRFEGLASPTNPSGTFFLYQANTRWITSWWMRLPADFPIDSRRWQVVMQMKQTGASANSGGTPVLALEARHNDWVLTQSASAGDSSSTHELYRAPAQVGVWTYLALDVTYSPDPSVGRVRLLANGNLSPTFHTYTQKYEIPPGSDGLEPGDPIPSHLRMGIYHDSSLPGTHVDFTSVTVWEVPTLVRFLQL